MDDLMDDDIDFGEHLKSAGSSSGYIVETRSGRGRTDHRDGMVGGKIPVYLGDGRKIMCSPEKIKIIGYTD